MYWKNVSESWKVLLWKKKRKLQKIAKKEKNDDASDVKKVGLALGWKWGFGTRPEELHQVH